MIGNNIKKLRQANGMTQKELAKQIGCAEITIRQYESNKREPNIDMMKKIAKYFDIALYMLLDDSFQLPDITSDEWKKRARFVGDTNMIKPPQFTAPMNTAADTVVIDIEQDTSHPFYILQEKVKRGEKLSNDQKEEYHRYVEEAWDSVLKSANKLGEKISECFQQLNESGQKKLVDHAEMLTKIPEYRKDNNTPTDKP